MYEPVSRYELIEGYDRQPSKEETLYQNEVKMQVFQLKGAYCSPFSYRVSNFAIAKLSLFIPLL